MQNKKFVSSLILLPLLFLTVGKEDYLHVDSGADVYYL